jgi:peptide/nickel transport system ATP-binding protein
MAEPILSIKGLTKTFKLQGREDVHAVKDATFDLMPGECLGVIGESGSGKTTLVNMITGLLPATEGTVTLDGIEVTKCKGKDLRKAWKKMQVVFQTPTESFDPRRTLGDGICESMRNNGVSKEKALKRAEELLELCGLPKEFVKRYPHEVSGGQCQRAAIARALAIKPKLLICDEATSSLDVTIQKEIIALLNDLRWNLGGNLSILFICHDIALVQEFCDRVLVMYKGKIVEQGTPDDVIRNPQNDYTQRLIDSIL